MSESHFRKIIQHAIRNNTQRYQACRMHLNEKNRVYEIKIRKAKRKNVNKIF